LDDEETDRQLVLKYFLVMTKLPKYKKIHGRFQFQFDQAFISISFSCCLTNTTHCVGQNIQESLANAKVSERQPPAKKSTANQRKEHNVENYIQLLSYNAVADNTGLSSFV